MLYNIHTQAVGAIALVTTLVSASTAWSAGFRDIIISNTKDADTTQTSLPSDNAAIYLSAGVTDDVKSGSRIKRSWIAVDTGGVAPANYKIYEVSFDIGSLENHVNSSLSKPNTGFPVGQYKIVLSVDGKQVEPVNFSVK